MPGILTKTKSKRLLNRAQEGVYQNDTFTPTRNPNRSVTGLDGLRSGPPTAETKSKPRTNGRPKSRRLQNHPLDKKANPSRTGSFKRLKVASPSLKDLSKPLPPIDLAKLKEDTGIIDIGLALGSPTAGSIWNSSSRAPSVYSTSPGMQTEDEPIFPTTYTTITAGQSGNDKPKFSRWKTLFKKTAPMPPPDKDKPSFQQVVNTVITSSAEPKVPPNRTDSHHESDRHLSVKGLKEQVSTPSFRFHQPEPASTQNPTVAKNELPPRPGRGRGRALTIGSYTIPTKIWSGGPKTKPAGEQAGFQAKPPLVQSKSHSGIVGSEDERPQLSVNIPDSALERYSVMFGNVLQRKANRTSALLVRRQGNTDKVKPLNELAIKTLTDEELMELKIQRRATSPAVSTPSPRLFLFPTTSRSPSPRTLPNSPRLSKKLQKSKMAPEKSPLSLDSTRSDDPLIKPCIPTVLTPITPSQQNDRPKTTLEPPKSALTPRSSLCSFDSDAASFTNVIAATSPTSQPLGWEKFSTGLEDPPSEALLPHRTPRTSFLPPARTSSLPPPPHTTESPAIPAVQIHVANTITTTSSLEPTVQSPLERIEKLASPSLPVKPTIAAIPKRTASTTRAARDDRPSAGEARIVKAVGKATVGVARSVSLSRASSVRTIRGKKGADDGSGPGPGVGVGVRVIGGAEMVMGQERLVARQVLTPTMVEVRNRKSQIGVIIDG